MFRHQSSIAVAFSMPSPCFGDTLSVQAPWKDPCSWTVQGVRASLSLALHLLPALFLLLMMGSQVGGTWAEACS